VSLAIAAEPQIREIPFSDLLQPVADAALEELQASLGSRLEELIWRPCWNTLERDLLEELSRVTAPILYERFTEQRPAGCTLLTRFWSPDETDRPGNAHYLRFVAGSNSAKLSGCLQNYPLAQIAMQEAVARWQKAVALFLSDLLHDAREHAAFLGANALPVVELKTGLSDQHDGGRSALAGVFANSNRFVYKPRSVRAEALFHAFVNWINSQNLRLDLRAARALDCETHGWMEYVWHSPDVDESGAADYFRRSGMLLCLLYLLGGNDFHNDNVVASGEYAVPVDLETLLQPETKQCAGGFWDSVMRTGYLPRWQLGPDSTPAYDLSALGGFGVQLSPWVERRWRAVNTDLMHPAHVAENLNQGTSAIARGGMPRDPADYLDQLLDGFVEVYRLLVKNRNLLLSPDGPLMAWRNHRPRWLFRDTSIYYAVIREAFSAESLADFATHRQALEKLRLVLGAMPNREQTEALVQAEIQSCANRDVPRFFASGVSACTETGTVVSDYFALSGFAALERRLHSFCEKDLRKQCRLIEGSLRCRSPQEGRSQTAGASHSDVTDERLRSAAGEIGQRLCDCAVAHPDGGLTWFGPRLLAESKRWQMDPAGVSLYDGTSGIAVFLAALWRLTGNAETAEVAREALRPIVILFEAALEGDAASLETCRLWGLGGLTGLPSVLYALTLCGAFLADAAPTDLARRAAALVTADQIAADHQFDATSGCAGAILALLAVGGPAAHQNALACGRRLVDTARTSITDWRASDELRLLTGFSHGAAGIAYGLARLYDATGEEEYFETAARAIAYERSCFDAARGNWPDYRVSAPSGSFGVSWCHGAPGIGLARIGCLAAAPVPEWRADLETALSFLDCPQLLSTDHLCCGNAGRIEFLLRAGRIEKARSYASAMLDRAFADGGFRSIGEFKGEAGNRTLFTGLAGIGYGLLRLCWPEKLPCIAMLEPLTR
jgi:type 2 lantibiotic biosynthesis protein LanM